MARVGVKTRRARRPNPRRAKQALRKVKAGFQGTSRRPKMAGKKPKKGLFGKLKSAAKTLTKPHRKVYKTGFKAGLKAGKAASKTAKKGVRSASRSAAGSARSVVPSKRRFKALGKGAYQLSGLKGITDITKQFQKMSGTDRRKK